jgi:hypothetical protein
MREYEACGQYKTRERLPHMVCVCVVQGTISRSM